MIKEKELYKELTPRMSCEDYTVSNESYELLHNKKYDMLVTLPVPIDLENYYESEDYISHTNSKKSLIDKLYQTVRKYTLSRKLNLINSFKSKEKTVLDVGCGTGDFLVACKKNGWHVNGVEPNFNARKIALEHIGEVKETLKQFSFESYDVITLWHVLEHVENLNEYILELKKLLNPNGVLVIAVPNYKSFDAKYYEEYWAAFDVPRHLWHFSQTSIKKLFNNVNMEVIQTKPMKFDSYYVSLLSEKYKTGRVSYIKPFWIGFKSNFKAMSTSEYSSLIYVIKNTKN